MPIDIRNINTNCIINFQFVVILVIIYYFMHQLPKKNNKDKNIHFNKKL